MFPRAQSFTVHTHAHSNLAVQILSYYGACLSHLGFSSPYPTTKVPTHYIPSISFAAEAFYLTPQPAITSGTIEDGKSAIIAGAEARPIFGFTGGGGGGSGRGGQLPGGGAAVR